MKYIQEVKSKSELEDKLKRENREAQIEMLEKFDKNWNDCGPTVDCVLFHDGSNYQLVLSEFNKFQKFNILIQIHLVLVFVFE